MNLIVSPCAGLSGELRPPSDKSLSHRAYMLADCAQSPSIVRNLLDSEDCRATRAALEAMGLEVRPIERGVEELRPAREWRNPTKEIDCGNSGTTMRLLAGLVASRPLEVRMVGDSSLSRRPMGRIAEPLRKMGATVEGERPPLHIVGADLKAIDFVSNVASAQVKSCVLLAGLRAEGVTWVSEPSPSRDHTERMLERLGVPILRHGDSRVGLEGGATFDGFEFSAPADISSAAFFAVAAAALPGSRVRLDDVGVNPTRTGLLEVLEQCGARFWLDGAREECGEPVADIIVEGISPLKEFHVAGDLVPRLIDEIPVLAVLATQCDGISTIRGARELRVKESDRIGEMSRALRSMGAQVEEFEDGLAVSGPTKLRGGVHETRGDHRVGMALAIAGLFAQGPTTVENADCIATSYPQFGQDLVNLSVF